MPGPERHGLSYGALLNLTEGRGTDQVYRLVTALCDDTEKVIADRDKIIEAFDAEIDRLRARLQAADLEVLRANGKAAGERAACIATIRRVCRGDGVPLRRHDSDCDCDDLVDAIRARANPAVGRAHPEGPPRSPQGAADP